MSAFLVQQETINKCVQALLPENASCEAGDRLGDELVGLNWEAICVRYREPMPGYPTFRYRNKSYTDVEKFKAMRCLLYQCSEGDVPDKELYHRLEQRSNELARSIVSNLPEFNEAPWE